MSSNRLGGPLLPGHLTAGLLRAALAGMALVLSAQRTHAQPGGIPDTRPAFKYFLTEPPASATATLPPSARNPFVARVRVLNIGSEIGAPLTERTKNHIFRATMEVVATIRGTAPACRRTLRGCELYPMFEPRGRASRPIFPYPNTPARGEYFVLGYVDPDGILALHGFPASAAEYEAWSRERWEHLAPAPRRE